MESVNAIIEPKGKQTLIKEGDQYWNPNTGEIFDSDGELISVTVGFETVGDYETVGFTTVYPNRLDEDEISECISSFMKYDLEIDRSNFIILDITVEKCGDIPCHGYNKEETVDFCKKYEFNYREEQ